MRLTFVGTFGRLLTDTAAPQSTFEMKAFGWLLAYAELTRRGRLSQGKVVGLKFCVAKKKVTLGLNFWGIILARTACDMERVKSSRRRGRLQCSTLQP